MCGRLNQKLSARQWAEVFDVLRMEAVEYDLFQTRYNMAPMNSIIAIRELSGSLEPTAMQWKLVPSWSKEPTTRFNTFNARVETIDTSGAYRTPFKRKRCLIPVAGFYEWPKSGSPHFDEKKPYYIYLKEQQPLVFAGVWDHWEKGEMVLDSCSIITTPANAMMAEFHDRMPAILTGDDQHLWLDHGVEDTDVLKSLLTPYGDDSLEYHRVSTFVNNWRNEGQNCIVAVDT